jgi:hypothetical protein
VNKPHRRADLAGRKVHARPDEDVPEAVDRAIGLPAVTQEVAEGLVVVCSGSMPRQREDCHARGRSRSGRCA